MTGPLLSPVQPMEVFVDDETKLTLHGLQQYYCKLKDSEKNRKLFDLLDVLEFNQVNARSLIILPNSPSWFNEACFQCFFNFTNYIGSVSSSRKSSVMPIVCLG